MIRKIINISNVGKFVDVKYGNPNWNGILEKCTAIYAENGSGKTTLTQIIKSIQGPKYAAELMKRKTLGSNGDVNIAYLNMQTRYCSYKNGKWNIYDSNIDIFDSYYVEDNVYIITLGNYDEPGSFYEVVIGDDAIKTYREIRSLIDRRKKEKTKRTNWTKRIKDTQDIDIKEALDKKIGDSQRLSIEIGKKLRVLEEKQIREAEEFGKRYLDKINKYLSRLGTELQLTRLNKIATKFVYYISVSNHELRSDSKNVSLRHTLSEGEKNCLAFAFFLARLELRENLDQRIVVFDDPISSLDANRRTMSLNILTRFARECKQFILLSHDKTFVRDFHNKINDCLVLKICKSKESNQIVLYDVEKDTLVGIFKDILLVKEFAEKGELSAYNPRDVVRCIRPIIEGVFRIKYYLYIKDGEWLGDFIAKVRNSKNGEPFAAQKCILPDLEDLNDYSKTYHHSNPHYLEEPLNSTELQSYCKLLFKVIEKI